MATEDSFIIRVDEPSGIYSPGYSVTGRLELQTKKEVKVKELRVTFFGYSEVMWKIRPNGTLYLGRDTFFEKNAVLLTDDHSEAIQIPPGNHNYPFTFQIPEGVPSSLETPHAKIRYALLGVMDRPWSFKKETKTFITVLDMLDLNTVPGIIGGTQFEDSQSNRFCCKVIGPVSCTIKTDRKGYVPGDTIVFSAEVNNTGGNAMQSASAQLVMEGWYIDKFKNDVVKKYILFELPHGSVAAGGSSVWVNEKLHIPPVPPTLVGRLPNVTIKYSIAVQVNPDGAGKDFYFPLEVVVGSVPLADIASQRGISLTSDVKYDVQTTPKITKAVYVESILGRQNTKDYRQTFDHQGMQEFAPLYPYYGWDIPDPARVFNVKAEFDDYSK